MSSEVELEQLLEALRALPKSERRAAALLVSDAFQRAVELVEEREDGELLTLAAGPDAIAAAVALEALRRRPADRDVIGRQLFDELERTRGQRGVFLLRALDRHVDDGFMTLVFVRPGAPWRGAALETLREIAARRSGEHVAVEAVADQDLDAAFALARALGSDGRGAAAAAGRAARAREQPAADRARAAPARPDGARRRAAARRAAGRRRSPASRCSCRRASRC